MGSVSAIGEKPEELATVDVLVLVVEMVIGTMAVTAAGVIVTVAVSYSVEVVEKISVTVSAVETAVVIS